jgi:competence protein ComEC
MEGIGSIQGVVTSYPTHGAKRTTFTLKPHGRRGYLKVFLYHEGLKIDYGDELLLLSEVEEPWKFEGFNYRQYLLSRGIWGVITVGESQVKKLSSQVNPFLYWGYRAREYLFGIIDDKLSKPEGNLLKAIMFGERAYLDEDIEKSFREAGVAHVLAVSGLHLGIIVGSLWWFLRIFRRFFMLSSAKIYLILLPLVLFYLVLVGFRVSLLRAAVIFGFLGLGMVASDLKLILLKWVDPLQGLAAAASVILMMNPSALFDVSFQLSFAATASILILWPFFNKVFKIEAKGPILRFFLGLAAVSISAQIGVILPIAYHFQRLYLFVLLANLVVIPMVTLALWGGIAFLLIGSLRIPFLATALGVAESWILKILSHITSILAEVPFSYLDLKGFFLP